MRAFIALAAVLAAGLSLPALAQESATAEFINGEKKVVGKASLLQAPGGLIIHVEIAAGGLPPGPHGVHIHARGTCDDPPGFTASGAHLNPDNKKHGLMNPEGPDAGDLPNLFAHADGSAQAEFYTTLASLSGSARPALLDADGAAIVIHANRDDHFSQPIGGAGPRIACGVVKK